jgi:hypothetical protein
MLTLKVLINRDTSDDDDFEDEDPRDCLSIEMTDPAQEIVIWLDAHSEGSAIWQGEEPGLGYVVSREMFAKLVDQFPDLYVESFHADIDVEQSMRMLRESVIISL